MQRKTEIQSLMLSRMRQAEALGFFRRMLVPFQNCTDEKFEPLFQQFEAEVEKFVSTLNPQAGSPLTDSLTEADTRRDNASGGLFGHIRLQCRHYDKEIAAAANSLFAITEKYAGINVLPYIQENGQMETLLRDLSTADAKAKLTKIAADGWLTELQAANEAFITLFDQRNEEKSGSISGLSLESRRACEKLYRNCITMLSALITVNGAEQYAAVVDEINELINYQKQVLAMRTSKEEKAEKE